MTAREYISQPIGKFPYLSPVRLTMVLRRAVESIIVKKHWGTIQITGIRPCGKACRSKSVECPAIAWRVKCSGVNVSKEYTLCPVSGVGLEIADMCEIKNLFYPEEED